MLIMLLFLPVELILSIFVLSIVNFRYSYSLEDKMVGDVLSGCWVENTGCYEYCCLLPSLVLGCVPLLARVLLYNEWCE